MSHIKNIILPRGYGKTTALIEESAKEWIPLVVLNRDMVSRCMKMAHEKGLNIPEPVTYTDYVEATEGKSRKLYGFKSVIIDDADLFLEKTAPRGFSIHLISITI